MRMNNDKKTDVDEVLTWTKNNKNSETRPAIGSLAHWVTGWYLKQIKLIQRHRWRSEEWILDKDNKEQNEITDVTMTTAVSRHFHFTTLHLAVMMPNTTNAEIF